MAKIELAIDFGGSFTTIYKKDSGLVLKEPTLIAVTMTNEGYVLKAVGKQARQMLGKTDERTIIFSPISEAVIKSADYASLLLKHFLNKVIEKKAFTSISALLALPLGISKDEQNEYIKVLSTCGIKEVILVPRILCSAFGAGVDISANNAHMVVDVGGVATDVGVVNLNSILEGATLALGGKSMDASISSLVLEKYNMEIGLNTCEKIKEEIGSLYYNDTANMEVCGVDAISKAPNVAIVYATDAREAMLPFVNELVRIIQTTVNLCQPEISADISRNGIILTGGFSNLSGLEKYLKDKLGISVFKSDDAENATAIGAGKFLNNKTLLQAVQIRTEK